QTPEIQDSQPAREGTEVRSRPSRVAQLQRLARQRVQPALDDLESHFRVQLRLGERLELRRGLLLRLNEGLYARLGPPLRLSQRRELPVGPPLRLGQRRELPVSPLLRLGEGLYARLGPPLRLRERTHTLGQLANECWQLQ